MNVKIMALDCRALDMFFLSSLHKDLLDTTKETFARLFMGEIN